MKFRGLKPFLLVTALASGVIVSCAPQPALAQASAPCAADDLPCWVQQADREWAKEHGDVPRNLTEQEEREIRAYLIKHYPDTDFNNP
jgi:hypothetical protein|nr:MAG TPA: hypothetical protein [Caudoviricetes sp.]